MENETGIYYTLTLHDEETHEYANVNTMDPNAVDIVDALVRAMITVQFNPATIRRALEECVKTNVLIKDAKDLMDWRMP